MSEASRMDISGTTRKVRDMSKKIRDDRKVALETQIANRKEATQARKEITGSIKGRMRDFREERPRVLGSGPLGLGRRVRRFRGRRQQR